MAEVLPSIAIVIDDMGKRYANGERVINLPGAVTCSFLPHASYTRQLAENAYIMNKEVMLHLPMQSIHSVTLDEGALTLDMSQLDVNWMVKHDLAAVPYVSGVNNHMGSLLTQHPGHMLWVMTQLQEKGDFFFLDSRTTAESVARQVAENTGLRNAERNIFLDNDIDHDAIEKQLWRLIARAKRNGTAIAIGHPYRETLDVLEKYLPDLNTMGIRLVTVSEIIDIQQENTRWQASLSQSRKAVKN